MRRSMPSLRCEDLGVFAAEFHSHIGLRGKHGDGPGGGQATCLHERQPEGFREPKGRGTVIAAETAMPGYLRASWSSMVESVCRTAAP